MMRCLITGGSGWVGHALAFAWAKRYGIESVQLMIPPDPLHALEAQRESALLQQGFDMVRHDLLKDSFSADRIREFDIVFHCAAYTHTEKKSQDIHVNDTGTLNLLKGLGSLLSGKRVVYFGSIASIDCFSSSGKGLTEDVGCQPLTVYGKTKLAGEAYVQEHAQAFGYDWTVLRLPTVYGAGYRPGGLFDVMEQAAAGGHPAGRVRWPGRLSLLYIEDLIQQLMDISERGVMLNQTLHLADPAPVSFSHMFGSSRGLPVNTRLGSVLRKGLLVMLRSFRWPHSLHIAIWRLCHLLGESMVFDVQQCTTELPMVYTDYSVGIRKTYEKSEVEVE